MELNFVDLETEMEGILVKMSIGLCSFGYSVIYSTFFGSNSFISK